MKTTINLSLQSTNTAAPARPSAVPGQKSRPNIVVARSLRQARRANH